MPAAGLEHMAPTNLPPCTGLAPRGGRFNNNLTAQGRTARASKKSTHAIKTVYHCKQISGVPYTSRKIRNSPSELYSTLSKEGEVKRARKRRTHVTRAKEVRKKHARVVFKRLHVVLPDEVRNSGFGEVYLPPHVPRQAPLHLVRRAPFARLESPSVRRENSLPVADRPSTISSESKQ